MAGMARGKEKAKWWLSLFPIPELIVLIAFVIGGFTFSVFQHRAVRKARLEFEKEHELQEPLIK